MNFVRVKFISESLHTRWSAALTEQTRCQSAKSKRKGEGGSSQKKAAEANTETGEKKVQEGC